MNKKNESNRIYKKAPIIEALIDINVQLIDAALFTKTIPKIYRTLKKEYPDQELIRIEMATINNSLGGTNITTSGEDLGYKFTSVDKKHIIQFRKNGFTFSTLGPYEQWETFETEAKKHWQLYYTQFKPETATRVAVKYINRLDIPANSKLKEYFKTYPYVLGNDDTEFSGFFMQTQLSQKEGGMAIISQGLTAPSDPKNNSIILDIDVFEFKQFDLSSDELWKRITVLRNQKNYIFENSITNKMRELIQ